jgi:phospholipid transport system substrate-binding protein
MKITLNGLMLSTEWMTGFFKRMVVLSLLLVTFSAYADQVNTEAYLRDMVAKNSKELVNLLDKERPYYKTDPDRFYKSMEGALTQIFDFQRFTLRVMGRFARRSTSEQRHHFLDVFKQSLFKAYSKALVDSGKFQLQVVSADLNSRSDTRATVNLDIISDSGNHYPVTYAMYQDKRTKKWLIENVIVSGVNIGLAFRDRFEQDMRANHNDMDKVINGWTSKVSELEKKKK